MDKIIWFFKTFSTIRFGWWDAQIINNGGEELYFAIALAWILTCGFLLFLNTFNFIVMVDGNNSKWTARAGWILLRYLIINFLFITGVFLFGLSVGGWIGLCITYVIFVFAIMVEAFQEGEICAGLFGCLGRAKSEAEDYNNWAFKMDIWKKEYERKLIKT